MKKWEVQEKTTVEQTPEKILNILLKNRNIVSKEEKESFLNPKLEDISIKSIGIDKNEVKKAKDRINKAIKKKEQIIVFGDYDVDGICGAAIIWETLNKAGAKILPYIPNRVDQGYGLSVPGVDDLRSKIPNAKLIITVDNGIVAHAAVEYCNKLDIDVIITDHHVPSTTAPHAFAIVHTTMLCGAGVAYVFSKEFKSEETKDDHLELVALATIADLVPLSFANRTLVKYGLIELRKTQRLGLLRLFRECGIVQNEIDTYEVGHIIVPRLNAMGRLESAMDSLRLLCTKDKDRAQKLAVTLCSINSQRQKITQESVLHAKTQVTKIETRKILFISSETYNQGVIGLVAGRLVEEYYLPSIVVSKGEMISRASARSIDGINIVEFIRGAGSLLVDVGGHPMAAGFTVKTSDLEKLQKKLESLADKNFKETYVRTFKIDCELDMSLINNNFYEELNKLSPFGMKNPKPTFLSQNLTVEEVRMVGAEQKHLKLVLTNGKVRLDAIGFGMGNRSSEFKKANKIDVVYSIDEDQWNGNKRLQLKLRDFKVRN